MHQYPVFYRIPVYGRIADRMLINFIYVIQGQTSENNVKNTDD